MRDYKFRAWINKLNRFASTVIVYGDGSWWYEIEYDDKTIGSSSGDKDVLEQYMGIIGYCITNKYPDKQEVYEGDIIMHNNCLYVIMWNSYQLGFVAASCSDRRVLKSGKWINENYLILVGNIHENQNLLSEPFRQKYFPELLKI